MYPWQQINLPLSGDVVQRIDPDFFFNAITAEAGVGEIEKEVFKKASYGRQLGLITEVLLAMADAPNLPPEADSSLKKLKELHAAIEKVKEDKKADIRNNARRILDKLKQSDPEALETLLKDYQQPSDK